MRNKLLFIFYFVVTALLLIFLITRLQSDKSYMHEYNLKLDKYSKETISKGYLFSWDSEKNEAITDSAEGVEVKYTVTNTMKHKSSTKGYSVYYIEIDADFVTYYKKVNDKELNKTSYFIFAPDFYDYYTGIHFLDNEMNDTFKTKVVNFKNKEYKINYKIKKEEIKSDWKEIDSFNKTMPIKVKYYITFELPNSYNGLIMGINGAYNGFIEDSNLWNKINSKDSYILDSYNTSSKLYSIKNVMKG